MEVEKYSSTDVPEIVLAGEHTHALMSVRPLPEIVHRERPRPTAPVLAAVQALAEGAPTLMAALSRAAVAGDALAVTFRPEVIAGLRDGTLHLMQSGTRTIPVAVDGAGKIAAHGTVVAGAGAAVTGGATVLAGGSAMAVATAALPVVIVAGAAYMQQAELRRRLDAIQDVVERIEARLEDADTGVCDAADQFLELVQDVLNEGGLTDYLRYELAAQRASVESLYQARRRWVARFKRTLEEEQIEFERDKGRRQPWVDSVLDDAKDGRLERELILFVRSLLSRSKLSLLAAASLAENGRPKSALRLIDKAETELRQEFFDLHRRLKPLGKFAPEQTLRHRLPGASESLERAHGTVQALVAHLDANVLPIIPDPYNPAEVVIELDRESVRELTAGLPGMGLVPR